jgi:hypothetical protein
MSESHEPECSIVTAKKKFEDALQELIVANYGPDHWLGDYIFSAVVIDMSVEGNGPRQNNYLHDGRGAFHSMRGLTEEQADYLIDLKEEEKADDTQD